MVYNSFLDYGNQTQPDFSGLSDINASSNPGSLFSFLSGNSLIKDPNNMSFGESFLGGRDLQGNKIGGWGMPLFNVGKSLLSGYQGFQEAKTARDTLDFQKDIFNRQFESQKSLINNQLRDQDAARTARDPNYKSTTKFL